MAFTTTNQNWDHATRDILRSCGLCAHAAMIGYVKLFHYQGDGLIHYQAEAVP
jgi:hypothetical protein